MDKQTFTAMIERRGYELGVHFVERGGMVQQCVVGDHEAGMDMSFADGQFESMTCGQARDRLDVSLAEGMRHVMHSCGQVLLEANDWWSGMGSYSDFEWGFYLIPLTWVSQSISRCPRCGEQLSLEGSGDLEVAYQDLEQYESQKPTVLPRIEDPDCVN
jgi:hypothetical protein